MIGMKPKQRHGLVPMLLAAGGLIAACAEGDAPIEVEESVSQALSESDIQSRMNQLYDIDNVVKVEITMNDYSWQKLKGASPQNGICGGPLPAGYDQYPEYGTDSVKITGSKYLTAGQIYTGVTLKKKSTCGSFSNTKPSLKLKFTDAAESTLGTKHLTLNNSIQDADSYVRQTLGNYLFAQAGVPRSRTNYAQVWVNGTKIENGIYINVEPVRDHLLSNPANGFTYRNKTGNGVYEIAGPDLTDSSLSPTDYIGTESASPYECEWDANGNWVCETGYQADLKAAIAQIKTGMSGAAKVIDVDQFIKVYAMEFMLKHFDGYARGVNNTYIYNDAAKTRTPSVSAGQVKFKLIPSGLDQILKPYNANDPNMRYFSLGTSGVIANLIRNDPTNRAKVLNQIKIYRDSVFSRSKITGEIQQYLNVCKSKLSSLGFDATAGIAEVVKQLKLARSASYEVNGPTSTESLYVMDKATGNVLHPSSVLLVAGSSSDYEVLHQGFADTGVDRWYFGSSPVAQYRVKNEAYNEYLHCALATRTPRNNLYVYATAAVGSSYEQDFFIQPEHADTYTVSGYFKMSCRAGNGLFLRFGTGDLTSDGRTRVYQIGSSSASWLSWY